MSKLRGKGQRGGSKEGRRDLAQAIGLWARDKLSLREGSIPSPEEIKLLLPDSGSVAMWDHLVTCIHTPTFAELAKKNLQLHLGGHSNKRAELHAKRVESAGELKSLELAVSQMELEISRLQTDIGALAQENEMIKGGASDAMRRTTLLSAHCIKSREDVGVLEEYTRRLAQRKACFCVKERETSYFARPGGVTRGTGEGTADAVRNMELESACKRAVREACEAVKELLSMLTIEDNQLGAEEVNRAKAQTWSKVERLLSAHPPASVVQCLCEVVRDETGVLHSNTVTLNLATDASQLRCRLDQSGVGEEEVAEKTSFLQSLEDHLMEAQLVHIRRCMDCERSRGETRMALDVLEGVKGEVEVLCNRLPSTVDQAKRELLRSVVLQQLEESGCSAMLSTLSSLCTGLESAKTQRGQALAALQLKKDRIDQFAKMTEMKQSEIRRLAKLNSAGREKLQRQRSELELYVKRKVCGHEGQLLALGAGLLGVGKAELQVFPTVDLDRAVRTPGLSCPTCDLSIHRLRPHQPSGRAVLQGLLKALGLPRHATPQALLSHLGSSLDRVETLTVELSCQKELIKEMKSAVDTCECRTVLEKSQDYDHLLWGEGAEKVNKNMLLTSQALAHCSEVQEALHEWWEEPSQSLVPWMTREGMSLSKWQEQWKVLTAKLRQLSNTF